ncbi:2-oxoacid:acceptor oxidoreductase subunit alpha [Candidatus Gottesmanbacteria bacterium]|nr:2-oxoacid:acceptor oxidoreductase subunit alpha [Candidatus Gottesmanbacteria bacterium]
MDARLTVTWKIGGEAGYGIISSGTMLARTCARLGYHIFVTNEYPSLIRGGHNIVTVKVSSAKFHALDEDLHILVALNKETLDLHKDELLPGAVVVFDPKDSDGLELTSRDIALCPVPLFEITKSHSGEPVMRNTVALGATVAFLGLSFDVLSGVIKDQFEHKGEEVIAHNQEIARAGYDYVVMTYPSVAFAKLSSVSKTEDKLIINGSEVFGVAAVRAGLKFAAIYPMTPINALISFLADHAKSLGIVYKQPEDEIAGINMALGASLAGVRSMVATSGGGFALMTEGISLAGMLELPVVVDLGMRVGPATGMPTWTEQGELQFAIHSGHGEFAKIVLAPGNAEQIYSTVIEAFHLADAFQVPVIVLTDKYMNESQWCVPKSAFAGDVVIDRGKMVRAEDLGKEVFKRYDLSVSDGVSPRSVPGMKGGQYFANSYEHDEFGYVTEESAVREKMAQKRLLKLGSIQKIVRPPEVYGDPKAEIALTCFGSTVGAVLDALEEAKYVINGKSAKLLHFTWMSPFPSDAVTHLLTGIKTIVDIEQNGTSQLASLIREYTGIQCTHKVQRFSGRPFTPKFVLEALKKNLQ